MLTFIGWIVAGVVLGLLMVGFFNLLTPELDVWDGVGVPKRHRYEGDGLMCVKCGQWMGSDFDFGCDMTDEEYDAWANAFSKQDPRVSPFPADAYRSYALRNGPWEDTQ
jgi:hypothetical protein